MEHRPAYDYPWEHGIRQQTGQIGMYNILARKAAPKCSAISNPECMKSTRSVSSHTSGNEDTFPSNSVPASIGLSRKDGRRRVSLRKRESSIAETSDDGEVSFAQYVASQPVHISTVLQHAD